MLPYQLLAPYLTPQQAALLSYEEGLPASMVAQLYQRLRAELAAIRTLVQDPVARTCLGRAGPVKPDIR
ncbi:MAG: hypothetical protein ABI901_03170, partial [Roseiflexaceae bacterium]